VEASSGQTAPARQRPDAPLGTLIYRAGLLSEQQLEKALSESMRTGRRLGQVLLQWNWLTEADLGRLLAGQRGLDFVSLSETGVDPAAVALVPEETVRVYHTLPIALEGDRVVVAIEDPKDDVAMEAVRSALGREVRFVVTTRSDLVAALGGARPEGVEAAAPVRVEAAAPVRHLAPAAEPATVLLSLRLVTGETVELGSFADEGAARSRAEEVIAEISARSAEGWLSLNGRYFNPAAIVSLDLS